MIEKSDGWRINHKSVYDWNKCEQNDWSDWENWSFDKVYIRLFIDKQSLNV
ncbi:MAG: hypothetical protein N2558_03725 [Patescibacteria group bacterium]|nr:hypothetical protein [Patescibacteria group bacterium]